MTVVLMPMPADHAKTNYSTGDSGCCLGSDVLSHLHVWSFIDRDHQSYSSEGLGNPESELQTYLVVG